MANSVIKLKRSAVGGRAPTSLLTGELALNITDKKLFTSDGSSVLELGTGPSSLTVNNAYSLPTADGGNEQIMKSDGAGNITFASISSLSYPPPGFPNSTSNLFPKGDYHVMEAYVGGAIPPTDDFGVDINDNEVYSCMDPIGTIAYEDLGELDIIRLNI